MYFLCVLWVKWIYIKSEIRLPKSEIISLSQPRQYLGILQRFLIIVEPEADR